MTDKLTKAKYREIMMPLVNRSLMKDMTLTKNDYASLAAYYSFELTVLREAIRRRYAILKEQNICTDCFKDVPELASLCSSLSEKGSK